VNYDKFEEGISEVYTIRFFGHEASGLQFVSLKLARRELVLFMLEDKKECKKKFRSVRVTSGVDAYRVEFGCNFYSAASICKI
jgi:hypothetical protein